ncbi:MAG: hypothetical protein R3D60_07845 [Paracoccaceae bacterium]
MLLDSRLTKCFAFAALVSAAGAFGSGAALAQQCPDWQLGGIPINTDAETAWVPQRFDMYAGGGLNLSACSSVNGHGYVTPSPNFSISYDARNMGRALEFRVESTCDTTMLINTASAQWEFNDDDGGNLTPRIRLEGAQSGRYDIWVGTFSNQACQATLIAETFPPMQQAPQQCPDWSLGGEQVMLSGGGSQVMQVTAGGPLSLGGSNCGIPGHGHMNQAPNFSLMYTGNGSTAPLVIRADGQCDTLMLVNEPNTNWSFNDDTNQLQPELVFQNPQDGRYDIWIGTFGGGTCPATVTFSAGAPMGGGAPSK